MSRNNHSNKLAASAENSRSNSTLLRGIAISAVVLIHILASIPGYIFTGENAGFYIYLDQFLRFSVPVFLAISGYVLTKRYSNKLELGQFFSRRLVRLLPLYLLWSICLWVVFKYIPEWNTVAVPILLWKVILLGRGDYHLYFIPLIIQLYILFPLLLFCIKKAPWFTVLTALVIQAGTIIYLNNLLPSQATLLTTDQEQYSLATSWIGYFVVGMYLAYVSYTQKHQRLLVFGSGIVGVLCFGVVAELSRQVIAAGVDPLEGLKFTKLTLLPFAVASSIFGLTINWQKIFTWSKLQQFFTILGTYSFTIYLSHTIILRMIFANRFETLQVSDMLLAAVMTTVLLYISYQYEKAS